MDIPFSYSELADNIKKVFIEQSKYQFGKNLEEFNVNGEYAGDYLNYLIFEPREGMAPRFYTIGSPYDIISKKAPQQALVFENGQLVLNIDYTHYADVRTGLMDGLVIQSLGYKNLSGKNILYLGTGKVATQSLQALKELFPEITALDAYNKSKDLKQFGVIARELGVSANLANLENIGKYDFIFAHTTSHEPVLQALYKDQIKQGAVITNFEPGEVAYEFFTSHDVNFIADYEKTKEISKEMKKAIEEGKIEEQKVIYLKELFEGKGVMVENPRYTLYRSTGTPMQNLAVLQLLSR